MAELFRLKKTTGACVVRGAPVFSRLLDHRAVGDAAPAIGRLAAEARDICFSDSADRRRLGFAGPFVLVRRADLAAGRRVQGQATTAKLACQPLVLSLMTMIGRNDRYGTFDFDLSRPSHSMRNRSTNWGAR